MLPHCSRMCSKCFAREHRWAHCPQERGTYWDRANWPSGLREKVPELSVASGKSPEHPVISLSVAPPSLPHETTVAATAAAQAGGVAFEQPDPAARRKFKHLRGGGARPDFDLTPKDRTHPAVRRLAQIMQLRRELEAEDFQVLPPQKLSLEQL